MLQKFFSLAVRYRTRSSSQDPTLPTSSLFFPFELTPQHHLLTETYLQSTFGHLGPKLYFLQEVFKGVCRPGSILLSTSLLCFLFSDSHQSLTFPLGPTYKVPLTTTVQSSIFCRGFPKRCSDLVTSFYFLYGFAF